MALYRIASGMVFIMAVVQGANIPIDNAMRMLADLGYFPDGDPESSDPAALMKEAVKNYQRTWELKVTGDLDSETEAHMAEPRCGHSDEAIVDKGNGRRQKRYNTYSSWERCNLTYRILSYTSDMSESDIDDTLAYAISFWTDVAETLTITLVTSAEDINFRFAKGWHGHPPAFDGRGGVVAHALYPPGGEICFDDDEDWMLTNGGGNGQHELLPTAVHELGHALGLAHTNVAGSIMWPTVKKGWNRELSYDDKLGLLAVTDCGGTPPPVPPPTTTTPKPSPCDGMSCPAGLSCHVIGNFGFCY